jgi:hypothetical protein
VNFIPLWLFAPARATVVRRVAVKSTSPIWTGIIEDNGRQLMRERRRELIVRPLLPQLIVFD